MRHGQTVAAGGPGPPPDDLRPGAGRGAVRAARARGPRRRRRRVGRARRRMRMQLKIAAVLLLVCGVARADGVVEVRGGYYKERSTRVEQPMVDAWLDVGDDGRLDAHFLIDSITSASASTGAGAVEFTERRYEGGVGYLHQLPGHVKIGAEAKYSTESDYFSTWIGARVEVGMFDQNTTLRFGFGHSFDRITNNVAVDNGAPGLPLIEKHLGT